MKKNLHDKISKFLVIEECFTDIGLIFGTFCNVINLSVVLTNQSFMWSEAALAADMAEDNFLHFQNNF